MKKSWTISEVLEKTDSLIEKALGEELFIYPTDSVYGIGGIVCESVISGINNWKNRPGGKFYSIIAPSFEWVDEFFEVSHGGEKISAEKLWAIYSKLSTCITLVIQHKKNTSFPFELLSDNGTVGVRIINHPFQNFVSKLGHPFITTSCNKSGEKTITSVEQIDDSFQGVIIDGGVLEGNGSAIFDGESGEKIR